MAGVSSRVLWKGAITFGLIHIPVGLHSAITESGLDFDWLDKRTMDPVGYKRINKKTGEDITKENMVKGIAYEPGEYVVISDQDIANAFPRTTQTIEIEAFVDTGDISFLYLERPYYVAPVQNGAKVYALLRETLLRTNKVGVARVVIQNKQHLAALIPAGRALVLNLLRWSDDVRPLTDLALPPAGVKPAGLANGELKMAEQLVSSMSTTWQPDVYKDEFKNSILKLVEQRVNSGNLAGVAPLEVLEDGTALGTQVVDLNRLLELSLHKKSVSDKPATPLPQKSAPKKTELQKTAVKKTADRQPLPPAKSTPRTAARKRHAA